MQEISDILRREVRDPRVGFVTVTDASVSPDLRHAQVFVSVLGTDEEQQESLKAMNRAAGFVRAEFARRATLRYTPDIVFRKDIAIEHGARINELLSQVEREKRDAEPTVDAGSSGDSERE